MIYKINQYNGNKNVCQVQETLPISYFIDKMKQAELIVPMSDANLTIKQTASRSCFIYVINRNKLYIEGN